MNHIRRSLGAITPDQLARANQRVDEINQRMARQLGILRQAETSGFDRGVLAPLQGQHAHLFAQLQSLTETIPSLSTGAFTEWIQRATGLEASVAEFEAQTRSQLPGASPTGIIVGSTIGALVIAGGIAALIWYGTRNR